MKRKIKILFLAANPSDTTRLELGREFSLIRDALLKSKFRDAFQLVEPEFAAGMGNFSSALIKHRPHIVHFCGHGSADEGIMFEGEGGYSRPAGKQELATLFEELNRDARLVFLNACHTQDQAEILGRIFDYTIGTNGRILDRAAGDFAGWFYRALADGATVRGAFRAAQAAVDGRVSEISELSKREGADDSSPFILQVLKAARPLNTTPPQKHERKRRQPVVSQPPPPGGPTFITSIEDDATVFGGITNTNTSGGEAHSNVNQTRDKPGRKR